MGFFYYLIVGRIVLELFVDKCLRIVENFRLLCVGDKGNGVVIGKLFYYKGFIFYRSKYSIFDNFLYINDSVIKVFYFYVIRIVWKFMIESLYKYVYMIIFFFNNFLCLFLWKLNLNKCIRFVIINKFILIS